MLARTSRARVVVVTADALEWEVELLDRPRHEIGDGGELSRGRLLPLVVADHADQEMSAGIVRRVRLAHVMPVAAGKDPPVEIEQIVIRYVPPVPLRRSPRLQPAQ